MKADWDDAPRRVKKGKKDHRVLRVMAITAFMAGGALLVFMNMTWELDKPVYLSWKEYADAEHLTAFRREAPPVVVAPEPYVPPRTAEAYFWDEVERERADSPARQTSFDDANYTPSNQINIIQSVPVNPSSRSSGSQLQGLTGSQPVFVHWEDARGRRTTWQTAFEFHNSRIDNHTFCLNVGKGSLEYRDCRKGAREWLKVQCRSSANLAVERRRMYCHAHSSYRT